MFVDIEFSARLEMGAGNHADPAAVIVQRSQRSLRSGTRRRTQYNRASGATN